MVTCSVCGLSTRYPLYDEAGTPFCCPSCREVAALLATSSPVQEEAPAEEIAQVQLDLQGLWCSSCAWLLSEHLQRTSGVKAVEVSYLQQQAQVTYDAARITPQLLKRRVRSLGYTARLAGEKTEDEEEAFATRLLIAAVLTLHDLIVGFTLYGRELFGLATPESEWLADFFRLMMFLTSIPILLLLGLPILRAGLASLWRGQPNLHTLIAIGSFSAYALSVRNFLGGHGEVYFDTASMLLFLVAIGRWLEMRARKVGNAAVERLLQQLPAEACLVTDAGEQSIPLEKLRPGQRVRVRPGERFPADGIIACGEIEVDESMLSGEPRPVLRRSGERVYAGTVNLDGTCEVIVTAAGESTLAAQIRSLLHQALWARAPVERLADRLAAWMTPLALGLALLTYAFWYPRLGLDGALNHALSVLLIACPCALGVATPLALWLGLGRAAAQGMLLRSTSIFERLQRVRRVFFDKTGTLTRLPLQLREVRVAEGDQATFLGLVGGVEALSEHPIAQAVVLAVRRRGIPLVKAEGLRVLPARGVVAQAQGQQIWIGRRALMEEAGLSIPLSLERQAAHWEEKGLLVIYAGWGGRVQGLLAFGERLRAEAPRVVRELQARHLEVAVLTGDEAHNGLRWQKRLGIPVHSRLSPAQKMAFLSSDTLMVGDGLNDAPALAAAGVGVALRHGTDVTRLTADVVLMRPRLSALPRLFDLSQQVMRRVHQNLVWAFFYNLIGIGLAMMGLMKPFLAALAMALSSAMVIGNSLRIGSASPPPTPSS